MSESMVKRVARAIEDRKQRRAQFGNRGITESMALARAAIEAMREPTEGMLIAAGRDGRYSDLEFHDRGQIWQAMIDEALK